MINAYPAVLARSLGLSTNDLAEIGGWKSPRFARDIYAGKVNMPADVLESVLDIQDDVDVITDSLVSQVLEGDTAVFHVFRANRDLRANFPQWPGRGEAGGGFVGAHYRAVISARDVLLLEKGIETDILFFD